MSDTAAPTTPVDGEQIPAAAEPEADAEETISRLDALQLDDPDALRKAVEAVLFVVDAPVSAEALAAALQRPVPDVEAAIVALRGELDARDAAVELRDIAGGVRLYTRTAWSPAVEAFLLEGQRNKLSQASLETLAVVAYRQPVSRARISAIRGVTVDGVVRTLLARGLLVEAGTDPDTGATLLATTDLFLERMGLQSLAELPSLAPLLPDAASLSALDDADGLDVDDL